MRNKSIENLDLINEIRYRILDSMNDKYDKSEGSFPFDLVSPVAFELGFLHSEVDDASLMLSVDNLEGEELELRVYEITGKKRKPATKAFGDVVIEGENGTIIEEGVLVSAGSVDYEVTKRTVIKNNSAIVPIQCLVEGSIGNVAIGEINTFTAPVGGLSSVYNPEPISNGYEEQTDESLREEYYLHLQLPATSGNIAHYKLWAKEVVGVGDVLVNPLWNGNGTVQVVITDTSFMPPDKSLIKDVSEHIENVRPIGADVTVSGADKKEIGITAKVLLAPGYNLQMVQDDFERELEIRRRQLGFKTSYVSIGKIGNVLLSDTEGVVDYEDLKLNGKSENVELKRNEIPVFTPVQLGVL